MQTQRSIILPAKLNLKDFAKSNSATENEKPISSLVSIFAESLKKSAADKPAEHKQALNPVGRIDMRKLDDSDDEGPVPSLFSLNRIAEDQEKKMKE